MSCRLSGRALGLLLCAAGALALFVLAGVACADAPIGSLTQLPGEAGCVMALPGTEGCAGGAGSDIYEAVAVSADGGYLYLAGQGQLRGFERAADGSLTPLSGPGSCFDVAGEDGCATVRGVEGSGYDDVAISADGRSLYWATDVTVEVFDRDPSTGALSQPAGTAGCVNGDGANGCMKARGEGDFQSQWVTISPDDRNVYVGSTTGGTIVTELSRNPTTGALSEPGGAAGCISEDGTDGSGGVCAEGSAIDATDAMAIAPDGGFAYVLSSRDESIDVLRRTESGLTETGAPPCAVDAAEASEQPECTTVLRGLEDPRDLVASADGANLYAVGTANDGGAVTLAVDPSTGALSQPAGTAGCLTGSGDDGESSPAPCAAGHGLRESVAAAIAGDGRSVYAAAAGSSSIAVLNRDPTTGALSEDAGTPGCHGPAGHPDGCTVATGIEGLDGVAVSPHGENVYGSTGNGAVAFARVVPITIEAPSPLPPVVLTSGPPPAGASVRVPPPSSRLRTVGRAIHLRRNGRGTLALACAAAKGSRCLVRGRVIARTRRGRVVDGIRGRVPGQTIGTLRVDIPGVRGRAAAKLNLKSTSPGLPPTHLHAAVPLMTTLAKQRPVVTTGPASGIDPPDYSSGGRPGKAVISGTVSPSGLPTRARFEIGFAPGHYERTLPAKELAVGSDSVVHLVTTEDGELTSGLTYHYRLVAENAGGEADGADRSFTVPVTAPPVNFQPVSSVTQLGQVSFLLEVDCLPDGLLVTGSTLRCLIFGRDLQPPLWGSPASVGTAPGAAVLLVHAPTGTVSADTLGSTTQVPLTAPASGLGQAEVDFKVEHPPQIGAPVRVDQAAGGSGIGLIPALPTPHLKAGVSCPVKHAPNPGGRVTCTFSAANTGIDRADLDKYLLDVPKGLEDATTVGGEPPAVLGGTLAGDSAPKEMRVRFTVAPSVRPGQRLDVGLYLFGLSETTRAPVVASASDSIRVGSGR